MDLIKSTAKIFSAKIGGKVIWFVGITLLARTMGATEIGTFFLFQAVLRILSIPSDFGIRGALEKRVSENKGSSRYLSSAILLKLAPLALISLFVLVYSRQINSYLGAELAIYLIPALILYEFSFLTIQLLNAELRVGDAAPLMFLRDTIWVAASVGFVLFGFGAIGPVYGILVSYSTVLVFGMIRSDTKVGKPSTRHLRSLLKYAKFDAISGAGSRIFSWLDVAIIGFLLAQSFVGAYEMAWKVAAIPLLLVQSIRTSIFPQVSVWDANEMTERIESLIADAILPAMYLVIPSFFGVFLFSDEILGILFGSEYVVASVALVVLSGQKLVQAINEIFGRTLQAMDRPDLAAYPMIVGVVLNLPLNLALIKEFGITGAAVGTLVSYALMVGVRTYYLNNLVNIEIEYKKISWCFCSAIFMFAVGGLLKRFVSISGEIELAVIITICAASYFIMSIIYKPIRVSVNKNVFQNLV